MGKGYLGSRRTSYNRNVFIVALAALLQSGWSQLGLLDPVRLNDRSGAIDTEHGHAHPLWEDFDGDGDKELLVGQFEGGKGKLYQNVGSKTSAIFEGFTWLMAGKSEAKVPYG